jgi:DNA repair/transcription protein MET18/MMS19
MVAHSLVEYFCARLENKTDVLNYRAGVCEVASSLHILSKWKNFLPGDARTIAITIFELASGSIFKNQKPATRVKLYEVIDFLFKNFQKPLIRDVKLATLVSGLVSMAELEKNPSCLGILFPLYAHISQKWPLLHPEFKLTWDSFIRYFPVTVGGAAQDPAIPGKELLRDLLLQCILSNDSYAKEAIPRFIDMLDTSTDLSANVKVRTYSQCLSCISNLE